MAVDIWPTDRADASEDRWTTMASRWHSDGVYAGFRLSASGTGMGLVVTAGEANMNGQHLKMETNWMGSANPGGGTNRQDVVALKLTKAIPATAEVVVIQGNPNVSPSATANSPDFTYLLLGYVNLVANQTNLASTDVVEQRSFVSGRRMPSEVGWFATKRAIRGALRADGTVYTSATYPDLAYMLGVTASTFAVPDMRNRFPIGANTVDEVGGYGGADRLTSPGQLPYHRHLVGGTTNGIILVSPGGAQNNYAPNSPGSGATVTFSAVGGTPEKPTPGQAGDAFLPPYWILNPYIFY